MARMFPDFLRPYTRSYAEKLLYKEFKQQLSDDFTVFHSVSWLLKELNKDARDGEADFVIIHPQLGILILEVKGGTISYDGTKDQWLAGDVSIKDPFKQARDNKYSFLRLLSEQLGLAWIVIGHAVAFPNVIVKENLPLPLDAPYEIVLDHSKLTSLSDSIKEIFDYWRGQNNRQANFNQAQIRKLENILAPKIQIPPISITAEDKQNFLGLSEPQFRLLDWLSSHRRVRISGCAGSGKTLLAVEKARRLRNQGFSVLLTCYNKALASFLSNNLKNIYVYNFHALCKHLFTKAGLQIPEERIMTTDKLLNEIY
ncbi:MAG TPA: NERD domain-containing protein, partial [Phormidium sp.]